ncbi:MAG: hypothetical protein FJ279_12035 [Planctomycetes bacterium]|nr:hypothetical protein [Planctomycetota bacterium]MBM4080007.1 hypothetical protein [Planctomycetota bacterium]
MTEQLERQLDSFDAAQRKAARVKLCELARKGEITLPAPGSHLNVHTHTFFSYNAYGYSPSKFAWLARKAGLAAAGIVDFDVLDGLEEFLEAGRLLGLKTVVSVESRVFVPEFETRVINSPGEPGIAYHMGVGFTSVPTSGFAAEFLERMRRGAEKRNRDLLARVNAYMRPVELSYERDVLPLTPKGNATERHLCEAFERKAAQVSPDPAGRAAFWREKLGDAPTDSVKLQGLIRSKTMKKGGVGYVQPDKGSFPLMADMNRFALVSGAIPTLTWLDGTSDGEQAIDELVEVAKSTGAAALNIIPDRNYTPGVKDQKLKNLYDVVALAEKHGFPIIVGTEMNAPGNKFVDRFETAELKPLLPAFLRGAHIGYAHSVLQRQNGLGYLSDWARKAFATVAAKNEFFATLGRQLQPEQEDRLAGLSANVRPERVLAQLW